MSFIPYLQRPPTHTQTGSAPVSPNRSSISVNDDPAREATPVRTNSMNDPHGPRSWHSNLIKLSGKDRALNEFSVQRDGEEVHENLVMLHGYGAGLGFFYKNFEGLSRVRGWKIYALDMLGMGRSSRPPFKVHAKDQPGKIAEAENWFIDALEEWRVLKKIDKFTLLGHSMGGYMAVAYALKYPGHLDKLILASPVGIPEDPYAMQAEMPEPEESTMATEFTQDQDDIVNQNGRLKSTGDNNNFLNARSTSETATKSQYALLPLLMNKFPAMTTFTDLLAGQMPLLVGPYQNGLPIFGMQIFLLLALCAGPVPWVLGLYLGGHPDDFLTYQRTSPRHSIIMPILYFDNEVVGNMLWHTYLPRELLLEVP